jgi:putative Mg2+ transporter-C (MgtC) family protein
MAIGSGLYYIGIMASVIVIFIQIMMHKEFFNREMERDIVKLKLSNECNLKSIQDIVNQQENYHTEIIAIDLAKSEPSAIEVTIEVALKNSQSLLEFIDLISEDSRVQSIKGSRG